MYVYIYIYVYLYTTLWHAELGSVCVPCHVVYMPSRHESLFTYLNRTISFTIALFCHRSHFGSRYKLGWCGNASLIFYGLVQITIKGYTILDTHTCIYTAPRGRSRVRLRMKPCPFQECVNSRVETKPFRFPNGTEWSRFRLHTGHLLLQSVTIAIPSRSRFHFRCEIASVLHRNRLRFKMKPCPVGNETVFVSKWNTARFNLKPHPCQPENRTRFKTRPSRFQNGAVLISSWNMLRLRRKPNLVPHEALFTSNETVSGSNWNRLGFTMKTCPFSK